MEYYLKKLFINYCIMVILIIVLKNLIASQSLYKMKTRDIQILNKPHPKYVEEIC